MVNPTFFAFVSNVAPQARGQVIESLATELAMMDSARPVLVNLDPGSTLRIKTGRSSREDPIARYGNTLGSSGIPVLKPIEAANFFDDAAKPRNAAMSDARVFISLMNQAPLPDAIPLFDALCFAVTINPASTAFVYGAIKAMETAGKNIPIRILVVGEPRIEKTAEFYVAMTGEFRNVGKNFGDLTYSGFMAFDPEESALASSYGKSTIEAFPEGLTRGQAKQAVPKIFARDFSELCADWAERERAYSRFLLSAK